MKDTPPAKPPSREPSSPSTDVEEAIRIRAYELYEQRGRAEGHADEDWLQAESEIKGGKPKSVAA